MPPQISTYSFLDLSGVIVNPTFGSYIFKGQGTGKITISMAQDRTAHNIAGDGAIMVSKLAGNNGTVSIECQQTSDLYKFLLGLYNYLIGADTSVWAATNMTLRNVADGTSHSLVGVSPSKKPDKSYDKEGAMVAWSWHAADIQSETT
jgi:hypothetical protein